MQEKIIKKREDIEKKRKTRKSDSNYTLRTPLVFYGNKYKARENTDV